MTPTTAVTRTHTPATHKRARPGGRAALVVDAVRKATLELLSEKGFAGTEIPEIAARANVHRTSIYRRWPNKVDLVLDTMLSTMETSVPVPNTGSLVGDIEALLRSIHDVLCSPLVQSFVLALMASPESATLRRAFWHQRFSISAAVVTQAIARGEVAPDVNARILMELASSPLFFRIFISGETLSPQDIREIATSVAHAYVLPRQKL